MAGPTLEPPARPLERTGFEPLRPQETIEIKRFFRDTYGFDLNRIMETQDLSLWRRGVRLFAFPNDYLHRFASLPVQSLGLPLGEESPDGFQLAHEWATRFGLSFTYGTIVLDDDQAAAWLRGEDLPLTGSYSDGAILVVRDTSNRNLARGKVQSGKLKNLYPRR